MDLRMAFAGFRHGHILEVYELAGRRDGVQVVAACEEDAPTRAELAKAGKVTITHASCDAMYREADFDVLAVGDAYGRRGEVVIRGLEAGKHVIADKPICTRLSELDRIAELSAARKLCVGCQLSLRDHGNFLALRQAVRSGQIGQVHTVGFTGQHPLLRGRRAEWYFQPGGQGGTINDIAIHGLDAIPWLTGRRIASVVAARAWNARVAEPPWFQDGAQLMLGLDNRGGVLGDVSYLTPDNFGYKVPCYWRFTLHGADGLAETSCTSDGVMLFARSSDSPQHVQPAKPRRGGYFEDFLAEIGAAAAQAPASPPPVQGPPASRRGGAAQAPAQADDDLYAGAALTTAQVLASSRAALLAQRAADENLRDLPV